MNYEKNLQNKRWLVLEVIFQVSNTNLI